MIQKLYLAIVTIGLLTCNIYAKDKSLDLTKSNGDTKVLTNYSGTPDSAGVMETYKLNLPEFKRGVYYRGQWWPYAGNRVQGNIVTKAEGSEGGLFLLLELKDGRYLAILPLSGDKAYAWFSPENDSFKIKFGTHGNGDINGDFPLITWAYADSAYGACNRAWKQASETVQIKGWMKLRDNKTYPEMFKYLGWCSWEGFRKNISSDKLVEELKGFEASPMPIRYFLVDDGHFNTDSLVPNKKKFPLGYKPLTDLKTENGISWVGMWHALMGNPSAMSKGQPKSILDVMMTCHNGRMVPKPDEASIEKFFRQVVSYSKRDAIDFLKVDFCGGLLAFYSGTSGKACTSNFPKTAENAIANPAAGTTTYARIYQKVSAEFGGLMNCNWHTPQFIFNSGDSSVGRCSEDYSVGRQGKAIAHLYHSYSAMPWLGQIAWGDHDMFHSSDKAAGRMMAVSKAVSGGPIYLSDHHDHMMPENILPLCYKDGLLPRPLAPAAPVPEDLFHEMDEHRLYRVMAPLDNKTALFVVYNFDSKQGADASELTTKITSNDYQSASGMIQPYAGKWDLPTEGLVAYDYYSKQAAEVGQGYEVSIKGFGDRLVQVSPIKKGWSVIGRNDKFLSAATVEILSLDDKKIKLQLKESGPFAIWLKDATPSSTGIKFVDKGNGLFEADLPITGKPAVITIEKR